MYLTLREQATLPRMRGDQYSCVFEEMGRFRVWFQQRCVAQPDSFGQCRFERGAVVWELPIAHSERLALERANPVLSPQREQCPVLERETRQ